MTARRLLHAFVLLFCVSLLTFALAELTPGNYFDEARANPQISDATLAALAARHGLDQPLWKRYAVWLGSLASGDGGVSIAYQMPVGRLVAPRLGRTLLLAASGMAIAWLLSLTLAIAAVVPRWRWATTAVDWLNANLAALPELALATGFLLVAARTGWLSTEGMALPALVLGLSGIPSLLPHMAACLRGVQQAAWLRAARSFGIRGTRLLSAYWLRGAWPGLAPFFGLSLASLLSSSLVVEVATGWPGLGPLMVESIGARDRDVVAGIVMLPATVLIAGNVLGEWLLHRADPRIRRPVE